MRIDSLKELSYKTIWYTNNLIEWKYLPINKWKSFDIYLTSSKTERTHKK